MSAEDNKNPPETDRSKLTEEELQKLDTACTPGDMWCVGGTWHRCNSEGRWVNQGHAC